MIFLSTICAALIGAMLAPYVTNALSLGNKKRDYELSYLEKLYIITKEMPSYCNSLRMSIILILNKISTGGLEFSDLPKPKDDKFFEIDTILDYHLSSPKVLLEKIRIFSNELLELNRPILEALTARNTVPKDDKFYTDAIMETIKIISNAEPLSNEILEWIKCKKAEVERGFFKKNTSALKSFFCKLWSKFTPCIKT